MTFRRFGDQLSKLITILLLDYEFFLSRDRGRFPESLFYKELGDLIQGTILATIPAAKREPGK
jgi:hypothetical protein